MATYKEWNKAIVDYVISGLPLGTTVFLSIDEDTLYEIGTRLGNGFDTQEEAVTDFSNAVKEKCINNQEIHLDTISIMDQGQLPQCIAYLGAMVLAAHQMSEEEDIADNNYFTRLRLILGLPADERGRPPGLQTGIEKDQEEALWHQWNQWLLYNGWLPSAEAGAGSTRYIQYPLSQALLRRSDKARLQKSFTKAYRDDRMEATWDRDRVAIWVRSNINSFTSSYLRNLLSEKRLHRLNAVFDVIYEVYTSIDWAVDFSEADSLINQGIRRLDAGLYRIEDPIMGTVKYYPYPRQPRGYRQEHQLQAIYENRSFPIQVDRPGWFAPIPIPVEDMAGGIFIQIQGDNRIRELVVPKRNFWLLVRDPDNEASDAFATWHQPGLGENFLLLCQEEYTEPLDFLKQEGLIVWDHCCNVADGWLEYRECKIISSDWSDIPVKRSDLYQALKPHEAASIVFQGGIRISRQLGWLLAYPPQVTVMAFDEQVRIRIFNQLDWINPVYNMIVQTNEPIKDFPALDTGSYKLEVSSHNNEVIAQRSLKLLDWEELEPSPLGEPYDVRVGNARICGAIVRVSE